MLHSKNIIGDRLGIVENALYIQLEITIP